MKIKGFHITQELSNLNIPRVLAIYGIVLYHSSVLLEHYGHIPIFYYYLKPLYAGVDILFVLSGFLMYYLYSRFIGQTTQMIPFVIKRFIRIYPLYIIITIGIVLLYCIFPSLSGSIEIKPMYIFQSLIIMPGIYPILSVGWILSYQLYFYFLFALLFLKRLKYLFGIIMLLSFVNMFVKHPSFFVNYFNLEFLLGILAAYCWQKRFNIPSFSLLVIGGIFLTLSIVIDITYERILMSELRVFFYGIPSFFLIWGLAQTHELLGMRLKKIVKFLSKCSYSVFLSHYPILAFFFFLFFSSSNNQYILKWLFSLLIALLGGCSIYLVIEKRLRLSA